MKRLLGLFFLLFILYSCQYEYQPRQIDQLNIKEFKIDSTSIRAIAAMDSGRVAYAGSAGNYGYIIHDDVLKLKVKYKDSIDPSFRSIASNGYHHYMLSIGNPALLYKLPVTVQSTPVYIEKHEKVFYDAIKFFDTIHGIAMGDPTEDCLSMILTRDGGSTWHKIPCSKLPKVAQGEAAFAASNTNIKVLGKTAWIVTGGTKARVFKTTDMGETWEVFNTPIIQGKPSQGIYSVDFADQNNGIIIGGDYSKPEQNSANKAVTSDGGTTWQLVAEGQDPNYKSCVQYVPDTHGKEVFAVGKTGISFSNDGGHTWKKISDQAYYVIQFVDRSHAWLAGNQKIGKISSLGTDR